MWAKALLGSAALGTLLAFAVHGEERIGPSFDCQKAQAPLAQIICADRDLWKTDILFAQVFWALLKQVGDAGARQLKQEDVQFISSVQSQCGVSSTGSAPSDPQTRSCVKSAYDKQRATWLSRLSGPALEEANRPIERHIALQRRLQELGLIPDTALVDGVYGSGTRSAIAEWQRTNGRESTGVLGELDALAIEKQIAEGTPSIAAEKASGAPTAPESVGSAVAAGCLPSTRQIKLADGSERVKTYVCRVGGSPNPQIEIEFDRLSEAAAGSLVEGVPYPELQGAFGSVRVLKNDIFNETKHLFDSYGTKQLVETCYKFQVRDAATNVYEKRLGGSRDPNEEKLPCGKRTIWYLSFPDREISQDIRIRLASADDDVIRKSTRWPNGWSFFYPNPHCPNNDWINCTFLWRPARSDDLKNALEDLNKDLENELKNPRSVLKSAGAEGRVNVLKEWQKHLKLLDLFRYVNRDRWHDDFLTVVGEPTGCGDAFIFFLKTRQMVLETAIVKNISTLSISLDGLIGIAGSGSLLRPAGERRSGGTPGTLQLSVDPLRPGERIAIPLRILFDPAGGAEAVFQAGLSKHPLDRAAADAAYKAIMAAPPGTIFTARYDSFRNGEPNGTELWRKTRESFGAPTVPNLPSYAYGPDFDLKGLVVGGDRIELDATARNFFRVAVGEGYGSCPFLYGYDDEAKDWIWRGKILHEASSPQKRMTQRVDFAGLVTQFQVREEELETSYIHSAELELSLRNGHSIHLAPRNQLTPGEVDGYSVIAPWQFVEFEFDLPEGIDRDDVTKSILIVDGYYRPNGGIAVLDQ